MTLSLVEDSQYDHRVHGRVRLVSIDEREDEVLLECQDGPTTHVTGVGTIPSGVRESISSFTEQATPADITLTPPAVDVDADSTDLP